MFALATRQAWFQTSRRTTRIALWQFKHPEKAGLVTVAGKPGQDLPPDTPNNILKRAVLK